MQPKLKRKLDSNNANENIDSGYLYNNGSSPSAKVAKTSASNTVDNQNQVGQSLSVQLHIQHLDPQSIRTNLHVSSTVSTRAQNTPDQAAANNAGHNATTTLHTNTNVDCKQPKQEPQDNQECNKSPGTNFFENDNVDVDYLEDILSTLEKEEGEISPSLLKDLKDISPDILDSIDAEGIQNTSKGGELPGSEYNPTIPTSSNNEMMYGAGLSKGSQNMHIQPPSYPEPGPQGQAPMYDQHMNQAHMSGMGSTPPLPQGYHPQASQPPMSQNQQGPSLLESGPAAETLKQMAAQHQNSGSNGFQAGPGIKNVPFDRNMTPEQMAHYRGSYPNYPPQQGYPGMPPNQNMYPYSQQLPGTLPEMRRQMSAPGQLQMPDYQRGTKPLSHYTPDSGNPANGIPHSLRQLQNQVRAQFPGPTSQAMHPGHPQMQITQSQNMQVMAGSQRMQMSQIQHVDVNSQNSQISMAQHQSFNMSQNAMPHQPSQQAYTMDEQMKMHMMQEKMRQEQERHGHEQQIIEQQRQAQMQQYIGRPPPAYQTQRSMGSNPLETMQNMVNQTNQRTQNGSYRPVKTENPNQPGVNPPVSQHQLNGNYPMQRQGSYPGNPLPNQIHSAQTRPSKVNTPTYTSALMRNQKPPNVNVGPDGLNISEQRANAAPDWGRVPPQGQYPGPRPQNPQQTMMPYGGGFPGQPTSVPSNISGIQRGAMMSSASSGASMMSMQQQQHIQMQQQQMHMQQPGNQGATMATPQSSGYPTDNYYLDSNPANNSTTIFNAEQQTDLNILDEIFS